MKIGRIHHDLLRRRVAHAARHHRGAGRGEVGEPHHLAAERIGHREVDRRAQTRFEVGERPRAQGHRRAPFGAERVRQDGKTRAAYVAEEECRAAGFHDAIGDLRDLEVRIDLHVDRRQLACPAQRADEGR